MSEVFVHVCMVIIVAADPFHSHTMVRLKTRYLLFELLYPDELPDVGKESEALVELALRQPSHPSVDARKLLKLLKDSVQMNFGDLGLGSVASTIASTL